MLIEKLYAIKTNTKPIDLFIQKLTIINNNSIGKL